jgi:predicted amidohydrolase YtcJ
MSKYLISNFILLVLVAAISSCSTEPRADLIVTNAKIYTVDEANPVAEAIAVRDGKIIGLGTSSEIEKLKGDKTKVIDAAGKLVLPGFVDSHIHAFWGGQRLTEVDLNKSKTIEELKNTLSDWIKEKQIPAGTPIWGVGPFPSPELFGGVGWPTKEILDEAAPENPVVLSRGGAHALWLNSLALKKSGIIKGMPQPEGGEIVFDVKTGHCHQCHFAPY